MENPMVQGILDIVEEKLREFGVMLPDDNRDGSEDPIVGYQYAELHDKISEYLEDIGVAYKQVYHLIEVSEKEKVDRGFYSSLRKTVEARTFLAKEHPDSSFICNTERLNEFVLDGREFQSGVVHEKKCPFSRNIDCDEEQECEGCDIYLDSLDEDDDFI